METIEEKNVKNKGSSINDVTQFLIIFDTPSPHRHTY
jgi:hypothetical protein